MALSFSHANPRIDVDAEVWHGAFMQAHLLLKHR
jgi:hypothetical protein